MKDYFKRLLCALAGRNYVTISEGDGYSSITIDSSDVFIKGTIVAKDVSIKNSHIDGEYVEPNKNKQI